MNKKGILLVLSGFSGAGKGTVVRRLTEEYGYRLSISATTRPPRNGEQNGREYFFLTRQEFESMIQKGQLIEWAEYVGNYYGTPKEYVMEQLASGYNVILEIEMQGALQVKKEFPEAVFIFLAPPSASELERRLKGRGTEDSATIEKRLARAREETVYMPDYDYIVVNDVLKDCVDCIHAITECEALKATRRTEFIDKMKTELMELF